MSFEVFGGGMLTIIEIFFGSDSLFFHDTMYPRMSPKYTKNMHLFKIQVDTKFMAPVKTKAQLQ